MVANGETSNIDSAISLNFRASTAGDEFDLVRRYVDAGLTLPRVPERRTVFVEPELETGYPDVVVTYSAAAVTQHWPLTRILLTKTDLRMLHSLITDGPRTSVALQATHGAAFEESLERLYCADLVLIEGSCWRARPLHRSFAIRRLIAIEAKVGDWRRGACQAVRNTWFASESYLLLPHIPKTPRVFNEASRFGIGLLTPDTPLCAPLLQARKGPLPMSYASWMFNEWAWRLDFSQSAEA